MRGKKTQFIWIVLVSLFIVDGAFAAEGKWENISDGTTGKILSIESSVGEDVVYVGAQYGLFKVASGVMEKVRSDEELWDVKRIALSGGNIFIAGSGGVYLKKGESLWKRLQGRKNIDGVVVSEGMDEDALLAWSGKELFKVKGNSWQRIGLDLEWDDIVDVVCPGSVIFVGAGGSVYMSKDAGESWIKIQLVAKHINGEIPDMIPEGEEITARFPAVRDMSLSGVGSVVVATGRGVFVIGAEGQVLARFVTVGLPAGNVRKVECLNDDLFVATDSRVFVYDEQRETWKTVFERSFSEPISCLKWQGGFSGQGQLWVAGGKYLYRKKITTEKVEKFFGEKRLVVDVPHVPLSEVHKMAIEYAEVSPEKIKKWRQGARWKAIFPKLSVGFSQSCDDNIELYKSSTKYYVASGPRERGEDWDIDLSWDLSDLIWNESQTSIDVRSKLMVQLRDQILEEVTRLYFERKRLVLEVEKGAAPEKLLRIEELTGYIDALTGGGFSHALEGEGYSFQELSYEQRV
ncbi:MAG: hypothetical protein P9L88_00525 [Candidatus Tantalella remota]|nr:hypothetical protein [Candidatus Tantalella remota]